jgi:hypothetical protein
MKKKAFKSKPDRTDFVKGMALGLLALGAVLFVSGFTIGCSNQTRTSGAQVSESELMTIYQNITSNTGSQLSATVSSGLPASTSTEMFFVEDDFSRPAETILAADDLGFINSQWAGQSSLSAGLQHVQIFFLDGYTGSNGQAGARAFALEMAVTDGQGQTVFFAADDGAIGQYNFADGVFSVTLTSTAGSTIVLSTTDLNLKYDQELADTVKFDISDTNGNAIGQISAMHLYTSN